MSKRRKRSQINKGIIMDFIIILALVVRKCNMVCFEMFLQKSVKKVSKSQKVSCLPLTGMCFSPVFWCSQLKKT